MNMSSLYLRGNTWWAKSYEQGKMVRWSLKTTSRAEAKRRLREYDAQPRQELVPARAERSVTWDEAAADLLTYYESYGTRNPREAGIRLRQLTKYFGGWELAEIDASAILGFVSDAKRRGKAHATINIDLATLRRAMRLACEYGKLEKIPVIRMLRPSRPRSGFFEHEAFEGVAAALPADLGVVVRIAFAYGWRVNSEVLTLTWRQVDFDAGTLRLEPGTTKNREGRLVYLTPELKIALTAQRERVKSLERELGRVIPDVFPTPYGRFKGQRRKGFVKAWARACREAGCPEMLRHDLRRTAARNLIAAGVSERVTMAILGHKTAGMLYRYCIVAPADLKEAARRLADSDIMRTKQAHLPDAGTVSHCHPYS
jgi:integrase